MEISGVYENEEEHLESRRSRQGADISCLRDDNRLSLGFRS